MIKVDFVFGATFPCFCCEEPTAHGISCDKEGNPYYCLMNGGTWVSLCKLCATSRTYDEILLSAPDFCKEEVIGRWLGCKYIKTCK